MRLEFIDLLILLAFFCAAVGGFRLGFVARVASWIGMAAGFGIAVALVPFVLRNAERMSDIGRLGVVIVLLLAGALLGQMTGLFAGSRVSSKLGPGPARTGDQVVGAAAGVFGVIVMLWLMLPTAANVPGWTAQQVRASAIARTIYDSTPNPPDALQTLRRLVGTSSFPSVFEGIAPAIDVGPPPQNVALPADVLDRVRRSTVKVEGVACHRTQDGSGFAVADDLIVTNAHVVAGEKRTTVMTPDGNDYEATVVLFDPARDLALLRVPRYDEAPLPVSDPSVGDVGAVFGHPGGQDKVAIVPAAVRREIKAIGRDLYEREQTTRDVLVLAAQLQQGDSGGAMVNTRGQVIGVAFAIAPDKPGTSYALNTSELRAVLAQPRTSPVSTGACLTE